MNDSDSETRLELWEPICLVISPTMNENQALARAGRQANKVFNSPATATEPIPRVTMLRLLPFWNVSCRSRVHYERLCYPEVRATDKDVIEISIVGPDNSVQVYPVNQQAELKDRTVKLNGLERCVTESAADFLVPAYAPLKPASFGKRLLAQVARPDPRIRLMDYLGHPLRRVEDLNGFFSSARIEGQPIFRDWIRSENTKIELPNLDINKVVYTGIDKVNVAIRSSKKFDSMIIVDKINLYFHPMYVIEFSREVGVERKPETKLLQMDGITGDWYEMSSLESSVASDQWQKVLMLVLEAGSEILTAFGPPGAAIPVIIIKHGIKGLTGSNEKETHF